MLHEWVIKSELTLEQFLPDIITCLVIIIGFFLQRTFSRVDSQSDEIRSLREEVGKLKGSTGRLWKKVDPEGRKDEE